MTNYHIPMYVYRCTYSLRPPAAERSRVYEEGMQ